MGVRGFELASFRYKARVVATGPQFHQLKRGILAFERHCHFEARLHYEHTHHVSD